MHRDVGWILCDIVGCNMLQAEETAGKAGGIPPVFNERELCHGQIDLRDSCLRSVQEGKNTR